MLFDTKYIILDPFLNIFVMCTMEQQRMVIETTTCSHFVITNIHLEHRGSWREERKKQLNNKKKPFWRKPLTLACTCTKDRNRWSVQPVCRFDNSNRVRGGSNSNHSGMERVSIDRSIDRRIPRAPFQAATAEVVVGGTTHEVAT